MRIPAEYTTCIIADFVHRLRPPTDLLYFLQRPGYSTNEKDKEHPDSKRRALNNPVNIHKYVASTRSGGKGFVRKILTIQVRHLVFSPQSSHRIPTYPSSPA